MTRVTPLATAFEVDDSTLSPGTIFRKLDGSLWKVNPNGSQSPLTSGGGDPTMGGDISGPASAAVVDKIDGVAVTLGGGAENDVVTQQADGSFAPAPGGGSQPITSPLDLTGCQLWLDASQVEGLTNGDPVASWPDESGNGFDATQGDAEKQPTFLTGAAGPTGALPAIDFSAVPDSHLDINPASHLFNGWAACTVIAAFAPGSGDQEAMFSADDYDAAGDLRVLLGGNGRPLQGVLISSGVTVTFNASELPLIAWLELLPFQPTPNSSDSTVVLDGRPRLGGTYQSAGQTSGSFPESDMTHIGVGGDGNVNVLDFTGFVYEIAVYNRALLGAEAQQLSDYLSAKWAIP